MTAQNAFSPIAGTAEFTADGETVLACQLLVLGAGPGGYSAAFRASDLGIATVLVDQRPTLGGVCLNVGCIPSKALLHTMAVVDAANALSAQGIAFGAPQIDATKLAAHKDAVVKKLTDGLAAMAKARKVRVIQGTGRFRDPHHLEVAAADGDAPKIVRFESAIIAAGSEAATLPFVPSDPHVEFAGEAAPEQPQRYDLILVAVGRQPNGKRIAAEKAGVDISDKGFIAVDRQMRTNAHHIYAIGDIVGEPMLAHKAVHQGHVAAENAAGGKSFFDARQIPSVAYTDPEIAWTGLTEQDAKARNVAFKKAVFPWVASGRALANGRAEGLTKLLFDPETHRLLGGAIVGTHAGDLIAEICLGLELGADATDIGRTILPHPTLSETIGMSAEAFEGVCTDLLPASR
jgi:pyruvate/2-oxoglutarate dehydrogenase complex dihydrolipoamide dehydrogenase (E3) component